MEATFDEEKWTVSKGLKKANETLVGSRRLLKFTFVYAYFYLEASERSLKKDRFEDHQATLGRCTEFLSSAVEKTSLDLKDVVNKVS